MSARSGPPRPSDELPEDVFSTPSRRGSRDDVGAGVSDGELPELGTMLDRYRVEELIGSGGFAVVFRGRHVLLDMPVAIKLLRPRVVRRSPALAMALCEEARLAARINHPNVVRVHDVHHSDTITFIVMELLVGDSLSALISRRGPMRASKVLRLGHAIASGLRAGLAEHVIHRDIKPANLIITAAGPPKIVDLGLARRTSADGDDRGLPRGLIGTPGYMAPEQAIDPDAVDFRADIYALGVTLYHATVGAPPFPIDDPIRTLALHASAPIPPPSARLPDVPPALERLLMWMLERNPARRPASYDMLIGAFRRALDELGTR